MSYDLPLVLLVQLPIPPPGAVPVRGNVPLAAGYLKLRARQQGLEHHCRIDIFPPAQANLLGDQGLVEAILARQPQLVGFSCYLWNIERTLWVVERLKQRDPRIRIVLGGPEITADNAWVLSHPAVDFAALGEGEQTFCELLRALFGRGGSLWEIAGLWLSPQVRSAATSSAGNLLAGGSAGSGLDALHPPWAYWPAPRRPLPKLDEISSPYLEGILDAGEEQMLLLETIRGCIFKCKFCYYPKAYDALYFLSEEKLVANLAHARQRQVREVVLLDPTLNQRRDFAEFVRLLARENPERQFTYFGELRAEGITPAIAALLREANFTEVEIGLQSVDPQAQELMDRKNNLKAFERGVRAMMEVGLSVKVDLILGLPGDTVDSIRRGLDYLVRSGLYTSMQVFNLAVLPGTAFRHEAAELGLAFQPRPPYYVTETPTLRFDQILDLMAEAQNALGVEFDPLPPPRLEWLDAGDLASCRTIHLDRVARSGTPRDELLPPVARRTQSFGLWLQSEQFSAHAEFAAGIIEQLLADNPATTLQVILEPLGDPRHLKPAVLQRLSRACFQQPSYLDKFYAVLPGGVHSAKRLVVLLPSGCRSLLGSAWSEALSPWATVVCRVLDETDSAELLAHEYVMA